MTNTALAASPALAAARAAALVLAAARAAGVSDDDLSWWGQYGSASQAPYYRGFRRRARIIERRLLAAGLDHMALKALNYTSGW